MAAAGARIHPLPGLERWAQLVGEIEERQASLRLLDEVMAAACWDDVTRSGRCSFSR
jgi:hypothetical protein